MSFFKACSNCKKFYIEDRYTSKCKECREEKIKNSYDKAVKQNGKALEKLED